MSTSLWRNRPSHTNVDESLDPVQFSVREGIVGVGWNVETEPGESLSWEEYERRAETADYTDDEGWVRSLRAIHDHMNEGDLCYTRDASGQFYLGRITGPWRYEADPEYKRHALVNVRDCDWYRIRSPEETVPTELLESFQRGSALQRIKNPRLLAFSQRLYEVIDSEEHYDIDLPYTLDNWLSDDDLQDLLAIYLQTDDDQFLIPSSVDQRPFLADGITINRISADRTLYQIQHQHDDLPPNAYRKDNRRIIYLKRDDDSRPDLPDNVEVLSLDGLKSVFEDRRELLPRRLQIIGNVLRENGLLETTEARSSRSEETTPIQEESPPKPVGVTTRGIIFFLAGVLLGLALMMSYGRWTEPAEKTYSQQQYAVLQEKLSVLRENNTALTKERNNLRQELAKLKQANESTDRTVATTESGWITVRIRHNDTLSELLQRFQGNQVQQDEVVERNNIRNRDLIYTGTTLSFPSQSASARNQMARN